ncbi:sigma 54-interacting transcriptional regulator [Halothermothrix orenii]|uniref:HTH-type transcriptional regulatory protein TyrR n=1 Tax=Halothermothrix orenii (strain H 168 / OCM 544 / DSM 9562) TaxID=373903 RepID=B8D1H9_HALOH|nr:sigma 54-interacting transcriptional regulator [Halothermothrix orenii]ACL69056.1 putative PAS/PAC sensor protein [Halothermothrix orenii H 168]
MVGLIETIKDRCHECYACVRNCPVKAVRVKNRQAEVISDRCIHCGNCVLVCSQGAKKVRDFKEIAKQFLQDNDKIVAGLAPSFPSYGNQLSLDDWVSYLKSLGFNRVYEVAWGAEMVIKEYKKILKKATGPVISSACPVIVNLIKKYYPDLLTYLATIVSPMKALYRYIKKIEGNDVKVVLIGPCLAKKGEFEGYEDVVVLTFSEIAEPGQNSGDYQKIITASKQEVTDRRNTDTIKREPDDESRALPLAGGLIRAITGKCNIFPEGYNQVEGREKVIDLLNSIRNGEIKPRFVDALFCEGCINGVDLYHENYFKKEKAVFNFINRAKDNNVAQAKYSETVASRISLKVKFKEDYRELASPGEEEIWSILNQTNKFTEEDLLDCGACGYATCWDKAIAVYQGLAEVEMCLPYLINEKRSELKEIQILNKEMDTLINFSCDGLVMVSKDGRIERVNHSYLNMVGFKRQDLIGKRVEELEKERYIYPSVASLALKEKRNITLVENTSDKKRLLATANPVFNENGDLEWVVVNVRNLDLINDEKDKEKEKLKKYLDNAPQLDNNPEGNTGHIIVSSDEMKNILMTCRKIAGTDSTVLITGESGVGKEVVARYIHEQSPGRQEFVKINCAAIPESLLESELFGYETGAFSGAKRAGKPGLIEKADRGTLFLDEIGEMPLNMQAKLLQVLQERKLTRIGGVKPVKIDFRLIAATNRDLRQMVRQKYFRQDLFYRLNVVPLYIPPLRKRPEDILSLIKYFLDQYCEKYNKQIKLTRDAEELLLSYSWPGNVRELTNLIERLVVTCEESFVDRNIIIEYIDNPEVKTPEILINKIMPLPEAVARVEKKLLSMARSKGNSTYDMAKLLGVNQSTVVRKLHKYFKQ